MRALTNQKAFTLVEAIVMLMVIAIVVAVAVPLAFRLFQQTAQDSTRTAMQNLKQAMIGNPLILKEGVRSDFGFLGDIGCLPTTALGGLDRLLNNTGGNYPSWFFNSAKQAGAGWNGPYITGSFAGEESQDFTKDQWGNPYTYIPVAGTCPRTATLTSNGPDGQLSTSDDIILSIAASETTATVTGIVKAADGARFASIPVDINYPVNGTLSTSTATTDTNGVYTFISIPFGRRSVQARPTLGYASGSGITETGSGDQDLQFTIVNFTTSPVTITNLVATYASLNNCYQEVRFNGTSVVNTRTCSGDTATFNPSNCCTVAASSTTPPPQVVIIDVPSAQIPDLIISPQGTSALIELISFDNPVVVIPPILFTITLSNGSVIKFTPVTGG